MLEPTDFFDRGVGEATDVVGKEMYSFFDRGDRSFSMRPEGTALVVRASVNTACKVRRLSSYVLGRYQGVDSFPRTAGGFLVFQGVV